MISPSATAAVIIELDVYRRSRRSISTGLVVGLRTNSATLSSNAIALISVSHNAPLDGLGLWRFFSGAKDGVAGIYNRAQYQPEKKDALDRWAHHLKTVIAQATGANVTAIRKPRTGRPQTK